jgi:hypothetical protein
MRRALLVCASIVFAIACGDNTITELAPDGSPTTAGSASITPTIAFATTTTEDGLSISTDKDDYQPGDTVHFTGSGWKPGDVLDIVLMDDAATQETHTWAITVGDDGTFQDSTYVVDTEDLGVTFTLTATSSTSPELSLTVTFTDGNFTFASSPAGILTSVTYDRFNGSLNCSSGSPSASVWTTGNIGLNNNMAGQSIRFTVPSVTGYTFTGYSTDGATISPASSPATTVYCLSGNAPGTALKTITLNYQLTNQAPTVDAEKDSDPNEYSGDEGSPVSLTGDASDPDGNPLTTTWTYTAGAGVDGSASCSFGDVGALVTTVTCTDDGEFTLTLSAQETGTGNPAVTSTAKLTIANVAPTADFNAPSSVNEGTAIALSFTNADDASSVDRIAGFTYAFDCGSGYGPYSATTTASCPTTDGPETRTVNGKIKDKDDGERVYTANVDVNNVKPAISSVTASGLNASNQLVLGLGNEVSTTVTVVFTDPAGALDAPYATQIDCGNGTSSTGLPTTYGSSSGSCTYTVADVGLNTISVTVTDDDGAVSVAATKVVQVIYNWTGFFQPVDNDNLNVAKAGSAIPIKFNLGGNQGLAIFYVGDPDAYPNSSKVNCADISEDQDTIEQTVNAGGSSLTYDFSANQYVYVWKTDKAWGTPGTCRRLDVKLNDGTTHSAYFKFNK